MSPTPEMIFRRMDNARRHASIAAQSTAAAQPVQPSAQASAPSPQYPKLRSGTYRQLMVSHDRMSTRHLQ